MVSALPPLYFQACFPLEYFIIRALSFFFVIILASSVFLLFLQSATWKGKKSVSASEGALH